MSCEHAHLDGSYVLGSLSPDERLDFERHLMECAECSRSVRELAGIPGLLGQVDVADLEGSTVPELPASLLPSLAREVRGAQRRRSVAVAAVAAAVAAVAAVAVGAAAVGMGAGPGGEPPRAASPTATASRTAGTPMSPVGSTPVRADVVVAGVAWGTRLDLTCSYTADEDEYEASPSSEYALVVQTADGRTEQVASWRGLPGRTMRVSGATATTRDEIRSVEMRTADGLVVLRLSV